MQNELELLLSWENNIGFSMTFKKNTEPVKTILQMDENGKVSELWPHIERVCKEFLKLKLTEIGQDMKLP